MNDSELQLLAEVRRLRKIEAAAGDVIEYARRDFFFKKSTAYKCLAAALKTKKEKP
jgi:hypothetical protein